MFSGSNLRDSVVRTCSKGAASYSSIYTMLHTPFYCLFLMMWEKKRNDDGDGDHDDDDEHVETYTQTDYMVVLFSLLVVADSLAPHGCCRLLFPFDFWLLRLSNSNILLSSVYLW